MVFIGGLSMSFISLQPFVRGWWQNLWENHTNDLIYPLDIDAFVVKANSGPKILGDFTTVTAREPVIVDELDFGNLENWFTTGDIHAAKQTDEEYTLEIEKLKINNALVKVGGLNIDHNLVQFNTDVNIGDFGTPVIFGHSMLRQFYNPKESNKERYKGIFSTIMTLELGDEIKVHTGCLTYTYTVVEKKEVKPDDDYIMRQDSSRKLLKLVTCTPEGTRLRRGVITAELKL
ncbi:sortase [bacterium]|nr:sortase [bacterium]